VDIDKKLNAWRARLLAPNVDAEALGRELKVLIWEPLRPLLNGVHTVLISPDGDLNFLPWAALPGDQPGSFLVDQYAFGTVSSARQFLAWGHTQEPQARAQGLFALGGVDFEKADLGEHSRLAATAKARASGEAFGSPPLDGARLRPLPETALEVRDIAQLYRTDGPADGGVAILTGADASKQRVRVAITGRRYVHLATHGFFAREQVRSLARPVGERIALLPLDRMSRDELIGWAPGLLSGLCFAGFNNPPRDPVDSSPNSGDVLMTAEEVEMLNLAGCELVVLSACETGIGRFASGEGVMGLQRAFHLAGARNVVASLWSVEDRATQALMGRFYAHHWRDGLPPVEALRRAQLDLLHGAIELTDSTTMRDSFGAPVLSKVAEPAAAIPAERQASRRLAPRYWAGWVIGGPPVGAVTDSAPKAAKRK
jgi:CHAT domain-containing protein